MQATCYRQKPEYSAFGLVAITSQPGRLRNGTVANIGGGRQRPMPDTVQFLPNGLDEDAYITVTQAIDRLLA
jgi:hypothetical protein